MHQMEDKTEPWENQINHLIIIIIIIMMMMMIIIIIIIIIYKMFIKSPPGNAVFPGVPVYKLNSKDLLQVLK